MSQTKEYVDNLNLDPRLIGFEQNLCPFAQFNSSPRGDMFAGHLTQAQILKGAEHPLIFTGYETRVGEYEFDESARDQDAQILAVIPKYHTVAGVNRINDNPSLVVIYLGLDDKMLHYFEVKRYTKGSDGYGYFNKLQNMHLLQPDSLLTKDVKLVTSPAHNGREYGLGINANVAYMTLPETIEDAFVISQSLADRMESRSIRTVSIMVSENQHPLNLYGTEETFKFLPDIGEIVGEHGILCGFRTPTEATFVSDTLDDELYKPHYLHDKLYYAEPGAVILDIDFYRNQTKVPDKIYDQVNKYCDATDIYHKKVYDVYKQYKNKYPCSPAFNTLVTRSMERLVAAGKRIPGVPYKPNTKLVSKDTAIDYLQIDITYSCPTEVQLGFKLTGRDGAKGVVCAIWPDEDMPVDEHGIRADIVQDPIAVFNRMNPGQLYEQYLNRCSEFIRRWMVNQSDPFEYVLDYLNRINPHYAEMIRRVCPDNRSKDLFIKSCQEKGIRLHIMSGLNTISPELVLELEKVYDIPITPVTYNRTIRGVKQTFKTKDPVCIGKKYMFLLYKMPEAAASGIAYINQFKTPIRPPSSARKLYPISQTPLRFGEDEVRILTAGVDDPKTVMRLMCLQANSPAGVDKLVETLLTHPKPSRIDHIEISDEELIQSNTLVATVHHIFSGAGIESFKTRVPALGKSVYNKYFARGK